MPLLLLRLLPPLPCLLLPLCRSAAMLVLLLCRRRCCCHRRRCCCCCSCSAVTSLLLLQLLLLLLQLLLLLLPPLPPPLLLSLLLLQLLLQLLMLLLQLLMSAVADVALLSPPLLLRMFYFSDTAAAAAACSFLGFISLPSLRLSRLPAHSLTRCRPARFIGQTLRFTCGPSLYGRKVVFRTDYPEDHRTFAPVEVQTLRPLIPLRSLPWTSARCVCARVLGLEKHWIWVQS